MVNLFSAGGLYMDANNEFLKDVFSCGTRSSDVSTSEEVFKPTEAQKMQQWLEIKLQEELFKQDRSLFFFNYK